MPSEPSPPTTRIAFRVGITESDSSIGPVAGPSAARVDEVLRSAAEAAARFQASHPDAGLYGPEAPLLRASSSSQRFADAAVALGYAPCPTSGSSAALDLLVVVSPKAPEMGDALRLHVPLVWIQSAAPYRWAVLREPADLRRLRPREDPEGLAEAVGALVADELALPEPEAAEARAHSLDFADERGRAPLASLAWPVFSDLAGAARLRAPVLRNGPALAGQEDRLGSHLAWADWLAGGYADAYRGAGVATWLLAAAAVAATALPGTTGLPAAPFLGLALAALAAVLWLMLIGRRRRWYERWKEYRLLAELIRRLMLLSPLGVGWPPPRTPAALAVYGDPSRAWMYWRLRALARETAAADPQMDPQDLLGGLEALERESKEQADAHAGLQERFGRLHHRLQKLAFGLFALAAAVLAMDLLLVLVPAAQGKAGGWLTLSAIGLTALAAALLGIDRHGDFWRLSKRSRAMEGGMRSFAAAFAAFREALSRGEAVTPAEVAIVAERMTDALVEDVVDWRAAVLDRPQSA